MLDVHAPEHPISGVREFSLHLFTITCGLLIALGLENAAEAVHHRQERREAAEMIRRELEENRESLRKAQPALVDQMKAVRATLSFVEARGGGDMKPPSPKLGFGFSESEIQDVAWTTASTRGVLAYMTYQQVSDFAGAYREQALLQKTEQQALNDFLLLSSFGNETQDPNSLTKERATEVLPYLRRAVGDLTGVYAVGQGTKAAYDAVLK